MKRCWIFVLVLNLSLVAQETTTSLRGEIFGANPADRLSVEVYEQSRRTLINQVPVFGDGRFEVSGVRAGVYYEIRVVRQNGERLQSEYVMSSPSVPVEIHLTRQPASTAGNAGPVSVYRLHHKVPGKASSELKKAEMAWRSGKPEESIERLERALKLDPGYMEAHNNLGSKLLVRGQRDRAEQEFRKSIELDPTAAYGHLNLALCLLAGSKDRDTAREAEMHARKALQLDPASVSARYALGLSLASLNSEQALPYLRESADRFPHALLAAANLLDRLGRHQEAREWRAIMPQDPEGR